MYKHILICLNEYESHFIPTIALAEQMQANGCQVTYMGFLEIENCVRNRGFKFIPLKSTNGTVIKSHIKEHRFKTLEKVYLKLHLEIKRKLQSLHADIVLIGISRYQLYLLPTLDCGKEVLLYSLCAGYPSFDFRSPPITSRFICDIPIAKYFVNCMSWTSRLIRKSLRVNAIKERCYYPWSTIKRYCKENNIRFKFGVDGLFPDYPIVVFGTSILEPYKMQGVTYLGIGNNIVERQKEDKETGNKKPLIYCTLGTMNQRYPKAKEFYKAMIEVFRINPQWRLIVSTGKIDVDSSNIPENVQLFAYAPQTELLKFADLAIIHGGHSTLKECISQSVPMIVVPCCYDQLGNAARVVRSKIGKTDFMLLSSIIERYKGINTKRITPSRLQKLIEQVLYEPMYRRNAEILQKKVKDANELKAWIDKTNV